MDWSKAKNVLIVIFLVLNVVLLFINYDTLGSGQAESKEILSNTDAVLNSRGVKLKCKIPTSVKGAMLTFENTQLDKVGIAQILLGVDPNSKSIDAVKEIVGNNKSLLFENESFTYINKNKGADVEISSVSDAQKLLTKLFKKLGLHFSEYILDKSIKNKDNSYELKYIHKHQGYLIYDDYIRAVIDSGGLKTLEYKYREAKSLKQDSDEEPLVEAYQILIGASDIKDTYIESIDIGFIKSKSDKETKSSFEELVWRVKSNNSEVFYDAKNGTRLDF